MCGVVFGLDCARTVRSVSPYLTWTLPIPADTRTTFLTAAASQNRKSKELSPRIETNVTLVTSQSESISTSTSSTKNKYPISVVQITDIHIDPYYEEGANADCGEPLCCRQSAGSPASKSKTAGTWGDYRNCDTPVSALKSALEHISATHPEVSFF